MPSGTLKKIRVAVAIVFIILTSLLFLDFTYSLSETFIDSVLFLQFVPSLLKFIRLLGIAATGFILITFLSFIFGRVYCSWVCPLGILQDVVIFFKRKFSRKKKFNYQKPYNFFRYGVLAITIVFLLLGNMLLLVFLDPYSIFGKITANIFRPAVIGANNVLARVLNSFDIYTVYPVEVKTVHLYPLLVSVFLLLLVTVLAVRFARLYCNTLCPVGTFLGLPSKLSLYKIRLDKEACTLCGKCANVCKAGCIDVKNKSVDFSRCVMCFNCLSSCPQEGVTFSFKRQKIKGKRQKIKGKRQKGVITAEQRNVESEEVIPDVKGAERRNFLFSSSLLIAGALGMSKLVTGQGRQRRRNRFGEGEGRHKQPVPVVKNYPVTPPGSVSIKNFNDYCTACYLCVSACPTQVIQPSLFAYGMEGLLQPEMNYGSSFCNFDCTVCGEVCPTGAILPLTKEEKHITQMGKVYFIEQNCVVFTDNTDCGACSEHCPTKAVDMKPYRGNLFIPFVTPEICVGCGACEYACPTDPKSIYVDGNPIHEAAEKPQTKKVEEEAPEDFPF